MRTYIDRQYGVIAIPKFFEHATVTGESRTEQRQIQNGPRVQLQGMHFHTEKKWRLIEDLVKGLKGCNAFYATHAASLVASNVKACIPGYNSLQWIFHEFKQLELSEARCCIELSSKASSGDPLQARDPAH